MTTQEFDIEFDLLYNNIASNQAPGLDPTEKTIFLNQAQEEVVLSLYSEFETSEESRRYLSNLIKTGYCTHNKSKINYAVSRNSYFFNLPIDTSVEEETAKTEVWFITYESVNFGDDAPSCINKDHITVTPVTQDSYHRIKDNPFKKENDIRVLRLDKNDLVVELISKYSIADYLIKYICKPSPIILEGATYNGESGPQQCKLHEALHTRILQLAVNKAIQSWSKS